MADRSRPRSAQKKACFSAASLLSQLVIKLRKTKLKYAQRIRSACKLSQAKTFQTVLKNFTTMAALFTLMQFREIKKPKLGHRFTQREKIMALSLYKRGPRAYKWLRKLFVLPSPMTLNRIISRVPLKPGINENIFNQLKKVSKKIKKKARLCILTFGKIALSPNFAYSKETDVISGFVNNDTSVQPQIADHALVFMIQGAFHKYKQPITYYFCNGNTLIDELAQQITEVIKKVNSTGFKVIATVCDQSASNLAALKLLIEQTKTLYLSKGEEYSKHVFEIDNQEVIPLYDPPNLLKGIRNNLITKNLKCTIDDEVKIAKWQHLVTFFEKDLTHGELRLVPKLTENHIIPQKIDKQRVQFATEVFSETVGVRLGWSSKIGMFPEEYVDTCRVLLFFDKVFDSVNGSFKAAKQDDDQRKIYLRPLRPYCKHWELWSKAKKVFATMRFINKNGQEVTLPSIECWTKTLDNLLYLQLKMYQLHEIESIWLRQFNLDPLENFFGCIKSRGYRNIKPSCAEFEGAFAALLLNNLRSRHSPMSNCEKDSGRGFKSFNKFLLSDHSVSNEEQNRIEIDSTDLDSNAMDVTSKLQDPRMCATLNCVAGYVLKQSKQYIYNDCSACEDCLYDRNQNVYNLTIREFKKGTSNILYPSGGLVEMLS